MEEKEISISLRTHYYTSGTPEADRVWFVLHGYGQLAKYFIRKFSVLEESGIYVIAPQGLSRFYIENNDPGKRSYDRVGASWMTKENRLTDIHNYVRYLQEILAVELPRMDKPVTVLGFSQGAATACRWIMQTNMMVEKLILWSGVFPPDIDLPENHHLNDGNTFVVWGIRIPLPTITIH